jgi:hypothetical protein
MWHGGSAVGPRHLVPALPFLCLALPAARARALVLGPLLALSVAHQLAATAIDPAAPLYADVLRDHVYEHLLRGQLGVGAANLGTLIGLPGVASLVPLIVVWGLALRVLLPLLPAGDGGTMIGARSDAG